MRPNPDLLFTAGICLSETSPPQWIKCLHIKSAKVGDTDLVIEDLMNGARTPPLPHAVCAASSFPFVSEMLAVALSSVICGGAPVLTDLGVE